MRSFVYRISIIVSIATLINPSYASITGIRYEIPTGFSAVEHDITMQLLATINNTQLPGPIYWSSEKEQLTFNENDYRQSGINNDIIKTLHETLVKIPYLSCKDGCEYEINGQIVSLDKIKQSLTILDTDQLYLQPETSIGFTHNQFVELRSASNKYRASSLSGQGYLGLPSQAYGYLGWYYNDTRTAYGDASDRGVSTWYLQKNLSKLYIRSGRYDSRDDTTSSISTSINPSFDKFITIGSQDNYIRNKKSTGKIILFSTIDGDYEFYRDGRLIRRLPAVIGRNEFDYDQLPSGFYSIEIKLVNRNGQILSREIQQIANINYGDSEGWYVTVGKEFDTDKGLLSSGISSKNSWFSVSSNLLKGSGKNWVVESNITRPMQINDIDISPTIGLIMGDKRVSNYASLSTGNNDYGYLTVSHYQNSDVSDLYSIKSSSMFSYNRSLGTVRLGYNYSHYNKKNRHQMQGTWNLHGNGVQAIVAVGVQKDNYIRENDNYGIYINTTFIFESGSGTLNASYSNGKINSGGSYTHEIEDNLGTTYAGIEFNGIGRSNAVSVNSKRIGTRGDASFNIGYDQHIYNGQLNYNGMLAANKNGISFGRITPSGAAMLVETPEFDGTTNGFRVEGNPVGENGVFAVPVSPYQDIYFAKAESVDSKVDMNITIPANIVRAHPGQVYPVKANVKINMLYNGFMKDSYGKPISGYIEDSGDKIFPNGLFSITSSKKLNEVTVISKRKKYVCDLTKASGSDYTCN